MVILDGKATAFKVKEEIAASVDALKTKKEKTPHLAAVLVGSDGASMTYVKNKVRACESVGFGSTLIKLPESTSEEKVLQTIEDLNANPLIDGFIVQLPLPKHINEQKILLSIDPNKDVDGFHPTNVGKMTLEMPTLLPATPYGILELLRRYQIETAGKNIVVIGRSHIVGRPMSILLSQKRTLGNGTVTLVHRHTKNINQLTLKADIIIAAMGQPGFLTGDMVQKGAVIIDVGITRVEDASKKSGYKLSGDVEFESVSKKAGFITPVPGGVGPMTIAMLLKNTLQTCIGTPFSTRVY